MADLDIQLRDYRLTTAEILYHMPDHPGLLQSYVWQEYDIAPKFPVLKGFLDFWTSEIEAPLHSITVDSKKIITPEDIEFRSFEMVLH